MNKKPRAQSILRNQARYEYVFGERASGTRLSQSCFAGGAGAFAAH